jgi:hypothetical protein
MENVTLIDLVSPWLILLGILLAVGYAEDWIHRHSFGIGYLLTKDKMAATRLFYVFFLPGIFIHEFIQYLVAGALNVPIKKLFAWPEPQENGVLRLNFVVVDQDETDPLRAAIVAASPFGIMGVMVWYISTRILDLHLLTDALGTGDLQIIWQAFTDLLSTPDFLLWIYLLFTIANSMVPNKADARGWPLILGGLVLLMAGLVVIGMGNVLVDTLANDLADALDFMNTALWTILVLDIMAILVLGIIEDSLEWWRGFKMDYSQGENLILDAETKKPRREPGSDAPLESGDLIPSIYNRMLPLPDPKERPKAASPVRARETTTTLSSASDQPERPRFGVPKESSGTQEMPARPSGTPASERPSTFSRPAPAGEGGSSFVRRDRPAPTVAEDESTTTQETPARPGGLPASERPSTFSRPAPAGEGGSSFVRRDRPTPTVAEDESTTTQEMPARPSGMFSRPTSSPSRPFGSSPLRRPESSPEPDEEEGEDDIEYVDLEDEEIPEPDDEDFNQDMMDDE